MIRPVQFKIVKSDNVAEIEEGVNRLIKDGWTFHGDLKPIVTGQNTYLVQAMCKTEAVFMPGEMRPPGADGGLLIPRG